MDRRRLIACAGMAPLASLLPPVALAHHGWSGFDQDRPLYLEGKAVQVRWRNPHAELVLEVPPGLKLPADLSARPVPAQSAPVDGKALLAKAVVPRRQDRQWEIELAPLTRMEAWKVAPIQPGAQLSVVGFAAKDEKGDPVLRVEYLYVDGQAYGLRSSPA